MCYMVVMWKLYVYVVVRVELMTVACTTDDATQYVKCHWGMERA